MNILITNIWFSSMKFCYLMLIFFFQILVILPWLKYIPIEIAVGKKGANHASSLIGHLVEHNFLLPEKIVFIKALIQAYRTAIITANIQ